MSFFDSEVVRAEMVEIQELQDEVYKNVFGFHGKHLQKYFKDRFIKKRDLINGK